MECLYIFIYGGNEKDCSPSHNRDVATSFTRACSRAPSKGPSSRPLHTLVGAITGTDFFFKLAARKNSILTDGQKLLAIIFFPHVRSSSENKNTCIL